MAAVAGCGHRLGTQALLRNHLTQHHYWHVDLLSFPPPSSLAFGARKLVADHLHEQGLKRPLIVTDRALGALPVLAEFKSTLTGLDVAVLRRLRQPNLQQVMDGAAAYKAHNADCVIGFGGGAALDVAKIVGVAATHEGDILEYVWDHPQVRAITHPLPYFVALPTTSAHRLGGWTFIGGQRKRYASEARRLQPKNSRRCVFADPELTVGLPPCRHGRHRH